MSKVFVGRDGTMIISDAEMEILPMIEKLSPGFRFKAVPPKHGFVPNLQKNKGQVLANAEKAERMLRKCTLCGLSCQINRYEETGLCGLRQFAIHSKLFVNPGLEPQINPSVSVGLIGCELRCCFCGWHERLEVHNDGTSRKLENTLWDEIRKLKGANSLEFVGGDPVCSVPGILRLLSLAPANFLLPVVWDDALYGSLEAYHLLRGLVDVFVPDFKFGNNDCSRRLSAASNYWEVAVTALEALMEHDARIIVRVLVLGGHFKCCHKKVLEHLRQYRSRIFVSVLDQYFPAYQAFKHPELDRLPTEKEIDEVRNLVDKYGLREVNSDPDAFWDD